MAMEDVTSQIGGGYENHASVLEASQYLSTSLSRGGCYVDERKSSQLRMTALCLGIVIVSACAFAVSVGFGNVDVVALVSEAAKDDVSSISYDYASGVNGHDLGDEGLESSMSPLTYKRHWGGNLAMNKGVTAASPRAQTSADLLTDGSQHCTSDADSSVFSASPHAGLSNVAIDLQDQYCIEAITIYNPILCTKPLPPFKIMITKDSVRSAGVGLTDAVTYSYTAAHGTQLRDHPPRDEMSIDVAHSSFVRGRHIIMELIEEGPLELTEIAVYGKKCSECPLGNECDGNATCHVHAEALIEGAFSCSCNQGYAGDGSVGNCFLRDACQAELHDCSPNANCFKRTSPDPFDYTCSCKHGFSGDGKECHECLHSTDVTVGESDITWSAQDDMQCGDRRGRQLLPK